MQNKPSMLNPALIAGAASGFLSGLPFISCCCCLIVAGGGVLAAYLYSEKSKAANYEFGPSNGAVIGILVGLVHAAVATVMGTIANLVMRAIGAGGNEEQMAQMVEQLEQAEVPPQAIEFIESMSGAPGLVSVLTGLIMHLVIGCVFGLIGGLIGGAIWKSEEVPPPPTAPVV